MNICVFCSSSNHIAEKYKKAAFRLGESIAESGNTLVYGGATGGLMTAVSEGAHSKNGEIIGIISDSIIRMGRQSNLATKLVQVKDLAGRKQKMKECADAYVVLPGGYGTMDEMFDVLASGIVGEHKKKLILVNEDGFFDCLLQQAAFMKEEKCIPQNENYQFEIANNIEQCIKLIINPYI